MGLRAERPALDLYRCLCLVAEGSPKAMERRAAGFVGIRSLRTRSTKSSPLMSPLMLAVTMNIGPGVLANFGPPSGV